MSEQNAQGQIQAPFYNKQPPSYKKILYVSIQNVFSTFLSWPFITGNSTSASKAADFCWSLERLKWSTDFFTTASEDCRKKSYLIWMHSFRKLPTAIMKITENISESPTVTNGTASQPTILMIISRGDKAWQHVSWQGNQSCIQREQFQSGSSGRVFTVPFR